MRRLASKVGRPCTVCCNRKRRQIEAALAAGTSVRKIGKSYGISPWALLRHRDRHLPPPVVRPSSAIALYERTAGTVDPRPSAPVATERAVDYKHRFMWVTMSPRPRMGARCEKCSGNYFWEAGNRECGGCVKCWHPSIDGRMNHFYT
jgi:hypothetical protein